MIPNPDARLWTAPVATTTNRITASGRTDAETMLEIVFVKNKPATAEVLMKLTLSPTW
jgi:hypothetical protein